MRRMLLTLLAAALLLSPAPAIAQIGQTAALTGTVTDASGAALPGVTVTASSESLIGGSRTATLPRRTASTGFPPFPPAPTPSRWSSRASAAPRERRGCNLGRPRRST